MPSSDDALQLVGVGVVVLIAISQTIAWMPARGHYPAGHAAQLFMTAGLAVFIWEPIGLGVLGVVLGGMGVAVWWQGRPEPELPRPRRIGFVVSALITGMVTYAAVRGWGMLGRVPDELRGVSGVFAAGVCALGTLAIADRARVTFRDALRRRLRELRATNVAIPALAEDYASAAEEFPEDSLRTR